MNNNQQSLFFDLFDPPINQPTLNELSVFPGFTNQQFNNREQSQLTWRRDRPLEWNNLISAGNNNPVQQHFPAVQNPPPALLNVQPIYNPIPINNDTNINELINGFMEQGFDE